MILKNILLFFCIAYVNCIKPLIGTDLEKCLRCICFTTTHCNSLPDCVKLHITQKYWEEAGSPTLNLETPSFEAYKRCMADTNCVLNTMDAYTKGRGTKRDTNCDQKFDCKDRLAIHFEGLKVNYILKNYQKTRFQNCALEKGIDVDEDWTICDPTRLNVRRP